MCVCVCVCEYFIHLFLFFFLGGGGCFGGMQIRLMVGNLVLNVNVNVWKGEGVGKEVILIERGFDSCSEIRATDL